jgi:RNA-directed DNA polymerase
MMCLLSTESKPGQQTNCLLNFAIQDIQSVMRGDLMPQQGFDFTKKTIFLVRDPAEWLFGSPVTQNKPHASRSTLIDMVNELTATQCHIVFYGTGVTLHEDSKRVFHWVEHPLPGMKELEPVYDLIAESAMAAQKSMGETITEPTDEAKRTTLLSGQGLSAFQFEQAISMAVSKCARRLNDIEFPHVVADKRRDFISGEGFVDIISPQRQKRCTFAGYDYVKERIQRDIGALGPEALEFGVAKQNGALFGGPAGLGKSELAKEERTTSTPDKEGYNTTKYTHIRNNYLKEAEQNSRLKAGTDTSNALWCGTLNSALSQDKPPEDNGHTTSTPDDPSDSRVYHQIMEQGKKNRKRYEKLVENLQADIVTEWKKGNIGKVRELQVNLTSSHAACYLAVWKVTDSKGSRTSGVDGVTWKTKGTKGEAVLALRKHVPEKYQAEPLRRVEISKPWSNKKRPLGIPTMMDRAVQALHLMALDPVAECEADPNSYGFRKYRRTQDAIEQARIVLSGNPAYEQVLKCDIAGCFDNIAHEWFLQSDVPLEHSVIEQWLNCGYIDKEGKYFPTTAGTPQGGIISPCLSNMALNGLEKVVKEAAGAGNKVYFIRYADDFMVIASDETLFEYAIIPAIRVFLDNRGLSLNMKKTKAHNVRNGVDFLGQHILKTPKGKIRITPSDKNTEAFLEKVKEVVKSHRGESLESLLVNLNPRITGWANYHREVDAKEKYAYVDKQIQKMVMRFLQHLHPTKPKGWIKGTYLLDPNGAYGTIVKASKGSWCQGNVLRLQKAAATSKATPAKIKAKANPYAREDKPYFLELEERRKAQGVETPYDLFEEDIEVITLSPGAKSETLGGVDARPPWEEHDQRSLA